MNEHLAPRKALDISGLRLVTSELVLIEIADGLSGLKFRSAVVKAIDALESNPMVEIVPVSTGLFKRGLELFKERSDKSWGLTDCTSFVIMNDYGITNALTTDEHFRQAGFKSLMLDPVS